NVTAATGSSATVSTTPGRRNGINKLSPMGFCVSLRAAAISLWIADGLNPARPMKPKPPASETAAARLDSATPPMPAEMIGSSIPSNSQILVCNMAAHSSGIIRRQAKWLRSAKLCSPILRLQLAALEFRLALFEERLDRFLVVLGQAGEGLPVGFAIEDGAQVGLEREV